MQALAEADLLTTIRAILTRGQVIVPSSLREELEAADMDTLDIANVLRCANRVALNVTSNRPALIVSTDRMSVHCEMNSNCVTVLDAWRAP